LSHESTAIYVAFKMVSLTSADHDTSSNILASFPELHALIWTTAPWTILANRAICFNKKFSYSIIEYQQKYYVVGSHQISAILKMLPTSKVVEMVSEMPGEELFKNVQYEHPLLMTRHPFLHGDHVTAGEGTGLVHTAPGHGPEDFRIGVEHNLEIASVADDEGRFTGVGTPYDGLHVLKEGILKIVENLNQTGNLLFHEQYRHKYPYDWRSKKPVIIRTTKQWFCSLETLKDKAIECIQKDVNIYPESGKTRLIATVGNRNEWCISRQRVWGVPIPVFYNKTKDNELLATQISIKFVIDKIRRLGADCWWSLPVKDLLAPQYRDDGCEYVKGGDTLDVWFDSGTSWYSALKQYHQDSSKVDLYLEGSDQHRGWFQSSLLTSVAITGRAPYRAIVSHGFVMDEEGKKMSKSLGNVVDPSLIVNGGSDRSKHPLYGPDVLRLWIASQDFTSDIQIGPNVIARQNEFYRKIRGTIKFMLGVLKDFNSSKDLVPLSQMKLVDRFVLHNLRLSSLALTKFFDGLLFSQAYHLLRDMIYNDYSAFYFHLVKDRLYADRKDSLGRRSAQTTIYQMMTILMKGLSPILCHLAEETYQHSLSLSETSRSGGDSIFLQGWFDNINGLESWKDLELEQMFLDKVIPVKTAINKLVETSRVEVTFGTSLDLWVHIQIMENSNALNLSIADLEEVFVVSKVIIGVDAPLQFISQSEVVLEDKKTGTSQKLKIFLLNPIMHKCLRCWKHVAENEDSVCARCQQLL